MQNTKLPTTEEPEILNIRYNFCKLAVKALNKGQTIKNAAVLLKVEERTLYNWMDEFGIVFEKGKYISRYLSSVIMNEYKV